MKDITLKIEGMSCQHCVMRVKKAIDAVQGVSKAEVVIGQAAVSFDEQYPAQGRLLAIADAFDAMTTNRPYHSSMPAVDALDELARYRGIYFDPDMVDAFIQTYKL